MVYELQCYFRDKCRAYYTAREKARQIRAKAAEQGNGSLNLLKWELMAEKDFEEIDSIIRDYLSWKLSIIVNEKAEVVASIRFCLENPVEDWEFIYTNEQYLQHFPQDELSQKFKEAYLSKDCKKMVKLGREISIEEA